MKVTGVAFTLYPVSDLPRARAFYEGVLGLTATRSFGDAEQGLVEFDLGPQTVAIGSGGPWAPSANGGMVALELEDFAAAIAHLRDRAVPITYGPVETAACWLASCHDPDGNTILLHHRKADLAGPAIVHQ
ncbi:MAG TPA: VOC family protein [Candidatus Synoicihabitans sp.]|nr:VOC family protein [Candidatus Synoicihabitans sp.]